MAFSDDAPRTPNGRRYSELDRRLADQVTSPILRAISERHGPVAVIHVDAHTGVNDRL